MLSVAHPLPSLGVIVVAAGRGERLGAKTPKAFVDLGGLSLVQRCVNTITSLSHYGQLVLVVAEGSAAPALKIAETAASKAWQISVVTGGRDRHESVRYGLDALGPSIDTVLVHDAARPLTPAEVFNRVIAEVHKSGAATVPAIAVADTLKRVSPDGAVISTEDRQALMRAQTPQGFARNQLEAAHRFAASRDSHASSEPTDDAEVVARFGGEVRWVAGSPLAHKVTIAEDLLLLEGLLLASERSAQ